MQQERCKVKIKIVKLETDMKHTFIEMVNFSILQNYELGLQEDLNY